MIKSTIIIYLFFSLLKFVIQFFSSLFIRCYFLNQTEIESFLKRLSNCVEMDGSTAAVIELTRLCPLHVANYKL